MVYACDKGRAQGATCPESKESPSSRQEGSRPFRSPEIVKPFVRRSAPASPEQITPPIDLPEGLFLALIVLAAVLLRVPALEWLPGLNGDESLWGRQAQRMLHGEASLLVGKTAARGPIYAYVLMPMVALFGDSVTALRLPVALAGSLLPLLVWRVLRENASRRWALLSALWLAFDPLMVGWSRVAMEVALLPLVNAAIALFLFRELRGTRGLGLTAAFVLAAIAVQLHPLETIGLALFAVILALHGLVPSIVGCVRFRVAAVAFLVTSMPLLYAITRPAAYPWAEDRNTHMVASPDPVHRLGVAVSETVRMSGWLTDFLQCMNGERTAEYLTGAPLVGPGGSHWARVTFAFSLVLGAVVLARGVWPIARITGAYVLAGLLILPLIMHFSGFSPSVPGHERYIIVFAYPWLPCAITGLLDVATEALRGGTRLAAWIFVLSGSLWGPVSSIPSLLMPFARSGGNGDPAFVTDDPSPMHRSYLWLAKRRLARSGSTTDSILAQEFHLRNGLLFLSRGHLEVARLSYFPGPGLTRELASVRGPAVLLALSQTPLGSHLTQRLAARYPPVEFRARDGRPVVTAFALPPGARVFPP